MIAAAFIGPGTVTTASRMGGEFGVSLWWVILIVTVAVVLLQEMSARLGVLTGQGLGENLRRQFSRPWQRMLIAIAVAVAIGFGNAAFQTGNLIGAAWGLQTLFGGEISWWVIGLAAVASLCLASGSYAVIEKSLLALVALLAVAFILAAVLRLSGQPPPASAWIPRFSNHAALVVLALVGTTIVPYNLFLHGSAAARRWSKMRPRGDGIRFAARDTRISVAVGGAITVAILLTAATTLSGTAPTTVGELAAGLPAALGGQWAFGLFAIGLAAAGLTSSVTAPLAAAYAVCGSAGWESEERHRRFRAVWIVVMIAGVAAALHWQSQPLQTLLVAQAANAIILPLIAGFLLLACNAPLLGSFRNHPWQNVAAGIVIAGISALSIWKLTQLW